MLMSKYYVIIHICHIGQIKKIGYIRGFATLREMTLVQLITLAISLRSTRWMR